ncbi:C45 family autoproteolytic acyltransferase/hydrolase [Solwaraspora sp. WMMD406]|uniref:C45 family autoproteolytic acyltransferase/hydolase n=1 Tax=Solwaraspora sp. WMMD406 TaxID=3016095 RepID=UPI0024169F2C|nr:C45 family peptidase [Solwaraspora sp. WMMD406]MDG4763372.1 C45 family autoproteolytic acyltransferase/hydrolase [Solwaraspora sp. WMMD406]
MAADRTSTDPHDPYDPYDPQDPYDSHDPRHPSSASADSGATLPVPLVSVSGTPAECGAGYGAAVAETISVNAALYLRRFRDEAGLSTAAVRIAGGAFRAATQQAHPRVAAMLDGVADGAGVAVEEIYALNARTELLYGTTTSGVGTGVAGAAPPQGPLDDDPTRGAPDGADGGCTTVGVLGTHSDSGHLLLGQNWDWHPDQRVAMLLLATLDERGTAVLTLAEAGMLAKTGLNSAGLGVCVNMLGCDRDGLGAGRTPGVPYHVLLRAVLEAGNLGQATRVACRTARNASINLLLGQAGPRGGELLDLEVVPGDVGWAHPVDGVLTHANHLETGLPVRDTLKDLGGSSLFRAARARRLLADQSRGRSIGYADLASVFHDHLGAPLAICRHLDERDPVADQAETVYSVLLDLDERRLGLAVGPPCRHDYHWMNLASAVPGGVVAPASITG